MTRVLVMMFSPEPANGNDWGRCNTLYGNGLWSETIIAELRKTNPQNSYAVWEFFYKRGYRQPEGRCNPETLDHTVIALECNPAGNDGKGVLLYCDDNEQESLL